MGGAVVPALTDWAGGCAALAGSAGPVRTGVSGCTRHGAPRSHTGVCHAGPPRGTARAFSGFCPGAGSCPAQRAMGCQLGCSRYVLSPVGEMAEGQWGHHVEQCPRPASKAGLVVGGVAARRRHAGSHRRLLREHGPAFALCSAPTGGRCGSTVPHSRFTALPQEAGLPCTPRQAKMAMEMAILIRRPTWTETTPLPKPKTS